MPEGQVIGALRKPGGHARQCAALPLIGSGTSLRVVLVTSRETHRWVIPKGWIEPGEAPHDSAAREAFEEAGVLGQADAEPIGCFAYVKRRPRGVRLHCEVMVYRLLVTSLLQEWPERRQRERRVVTPAKAAALVREPDLARLLRELA